MNEIISNNNTMPTVSACDFCIAPQSFLHANRITDFNILIYVTTGVIYVTEDEIDYEVHAGDLLFLKSNTHHFGKKLIIKGTQWYYAHFYLNESQTPHLYSLNSETTSITSSIPATNSTFLPKLLTHLNGSPFEQALINFTDAFHSNDPIKKWTIHAQFFDLLSQLILHPLSQVPSVTLSDKICDYLNTHYNEPFSASRLEQYFFLSYKHMAAIFKKEKQLTMQQYHTQTRMNIACKLLKTTLTPINKIAESLGYHDMLYFSRCFHQFVGMSPTTYRKTQIVQY